MKKPGQGMVWTGALLTGGILLLALLAPFLSPWDPGAISLSQRLSPPSAAHWMGTDQLGRDVFSRMLFGARISIGVGLVAVGLATLVGMAVGALAGYLGGWVDALCMRAVDILLCFPSIFLILAAVAFLGPSLLNVMVIIGLTSWMGLARLVRAEVLSLREREFVLAARAIGVSTPRLILRHLLPNAAAPIVVSATLGIGAAILVESALSFLGIGIQPPTPSWGNILTEGKATLGTAWWLTLIPGIAIFLMVLGCNLLGEGLKRRWSP